MHENIREDTHKKMCFFSGRTTKRKTGCFSPKIVKKKKKLSKYVSGYYKTKKKKKKRSGMDH